MGEVARKHDALFESTDRIFCERRITMHDRTTTITLLLSLVLEFAYSQSPLTTTFASTRPGASGGAVYFSITNDSSHCVRLKSFDFNVATSSCCQWYQLRQLTVFVVGVGAGSPSILV